MAYNHKEIATKEARLTSGHRMCAGCGAPAVARMILKALSQLFESMDNTEIYDC